MDSAAVISVLYVDDEPALLDLAKAFLEQNARIKVDTLDSAPAALEHLVNGRYDAIVSDYQMPVMNGLDFLQQVRTRYGQIPFILYTGRGREEVVIEAINRGVDFYLQKGGDPRAQFAELALKIRQAVQRRQVEARLAESEANLQAIIANTDDIIASYDTEIRLQVYNRACAEVYRTMFGVELYPGLRTLDLFPVSMQEFWTANNVRALAGESFPVEFSLTAPDGTVRTFESFYNPIRKEGRVVGFSTFTREITARKRAEEDLRSAYEQIAASEEELRSQYDKLAATQEQLRRQQQQLTEIANMVPGIVYQIYARPDGTMEVSYVNERGPDLFGLPGNTTDMLGWFTAHVDPRDRDAFLKSIERAISTASAWEFDGRFIKPSGEQIWFQGLSRPIRRGTDLVFNGLLLDITRRKIAEEALQKEQSCRTDGAGKPVHPV